MVRGLSSGERRILVAAGLPLVVGSINLFGATLALTGIQGDFTLGFDELRWVLLAFLVPDAVLMLFAGRLGEALGRRRVLFWGGVVFTVGAFLAAIAPGYGWLLASRVVEGVGAGLMFGGLLAVIADHFPAERLGRAFGAWALVGALAFGASPLLTGTVIHFAGWRWLFALNAAIAAGAAYLALRLMDDDRPDQRIAWDPPGLALIAGGLIALAVGALHVPTWGLLDPATLLTIGLGALTVGAGLGVEARSPGGIWTGYVVRAPRLLAGTSVVTLGYLVQELVLLVLVVYLFFVRELTVLEIGLVLVSYSAMWMAIAPLSGRLTDRFGSGRPIAAGAVVALSGALLLVFGFAESAPSILSICIGLALLEIGAALVNPASNAAAMRNIAPERRGEASGVSMMLRLVGAAAGIAAGASVLLSRHDTLISSEVRSRGGDPDLLFAEDLGGLLGSRATDDALIDLFGSPGDLLAVSASAFESAASTTFAVAAGVYLIVLALAIGIVRSERG